MKTLNELPTVLELAVREVIRNLKETRSGPCRQGGEECSRQREWQAPRF